MTHNPDISHSSQGGSGWRPRLTTLSQELGTLWAECGIDSEYAPLKHVILHTPGDELAASLDPDAVNMIAPLDLHRARSQHQAMAAAYRQAGVRVTELTPDREPLPNQMFMADVFVMTPEGAIIGRPASTVRAGEERQAARRLADLGAPIVRSISGRGTFEGADLMWLDPQTAIIGRGLRTNDDGAAQLINYLEQSGRSAVVVDLPYGTMHLMGMLRIVSPQLAIAWPTRLVHRGVEALRARGITVQFAPDTDELRGGMAMNFVVVSPGTILAAAGNPVTLAFYRSLGLQVIETPVDELAKAAGAIGCLTGIVARERVSR
ncbi:MAG: hypothetical protein RLZZ297_799 [Chloroflexota bacterium]